MNLYWMVRKKSTYMNRLLATPIIGWFAGILTTSAKLDGLSVSWILCKSLWPAKSSVIRKGWWGHFRHWYPLIISRPSGLPGPMHFGILGVLTCLLVEPLFFFLCLFLAFPITSIEVARFQSFLRYQLGFLLTGLRDKEVDETAS